MLLKIGRKRPNFCASMAGGAKGPPAQLWAVGPPKFPSHLSFHFLKIRGVKLNWDPSVESSNVSPKEYWHFPSLRGFRMLSHFMQSSLWGTKLVATHGKWLPTAYHYHFPVLYNRIKIVHCSPWLLSSVLIWFGWSLFGPNPTGS